MSDKNSSLNKNLSMEAKQKEVLFQNPNKLQNGLFGNEQKAAGNNLGLENKSEVSKKSGKMKYILFAIAVALFIIAGLTLLNIPLQFVVIKEIFSVIIVGSSGSFGVLLYSFYKKVDKKESELLIQNGANQLEIIGENKSKDMKQNQIIVEKPRNVIEKINDVQIISNTAEADKSKKMAENQIITIQDRAETPELKVQNEINRLEIISENKPKNIIQNQIIVEKSEQENTVEQIDSIEIFGEKTNKEESDENKVITQKDDDINNEDIENGKLNKLLERLKGNGLTVTYNSEDENWDIERPENVFEQIDEIEIQAKERPENITEQIDEIEITAKERPENVFEQIDEIEISAKERPENITEQIEEIQINELDVKERNDLEVEQVEDSFVIEAKERPENKVESIDEIEILGKEIPENITEQIDEIEINALEKPENVEEQIDEIQITAKERPESIVEQIDEIEIQAKERPKSNVIEKIATLEIIHAPKLEKKENQNDPALNNSK